MAAQTGVANVPISPIEGGVANVNVSKGAVVTTPFNEGLVFVFTTLSINNGNV